MPILPEESHLSIVGLYDQALKEGHRSRPARTKFVVEKTAGTFSENDVRITLDKLLIARDLAR